MADPESEALLKLVFDQSTNPAFIVKENASKHGHAVNQGAERAEPEFGNTALAVNNTLASGSGSPVTFRNESEHQRYLATRGKTTYRPLSPEEAGRRRFDRLLELMRLGLEADEHSLYSSQKPAVQVIVTEENLNSRLGEAWLEGIELSVSTQTAERYICTNGIQISTMTGDGIPLNHGRARRLFTPAQRQALILRDGGCRWPGCDRPPSFCEAHHIDEWEQGGNTDIENGMMLCRKHHMELHNQSFKIIPRPPGQESGEHFMLHPPPGHLKFTEPVPMPSKAAWLTPV